MDLRITPLSSFSSRPDQNRISVRQANYPTTTAKKTQTTNDLVIVKNKNINQTQLPLNIAPKSFQPPTTLMSQKGIVTYQQIERDKVFSEGIELTNRFSQRV